MQLSESLEDYLEVIGELTETEGHAHTKRIAEKLQVKMPSVTGALRQLEKLGLILYSTHRPAELTPAGREIASEVIRRHKTLTRFFTGILGLSPERASETACKMEHDVDGDVIRRFLLFSRALEKRRDAGPLQNYLAEAMAFLARDENFVTLAELLPETCAKIIQTGQNAASWQMPEELKNGAVFKFTKITPDNSNYCLLCGGKELLIPGAVAENLWCCIITLPEN